MKTVVLPESVRSKLHKLCGTMNLPDLDDYNSVEDFITDVTNRVSETNRLIKLISVNLGS